MSRVFLFLIVILTIVGCKKPMEEDCEPVTIVSSLCYENYSTTSFEAYMDDMLEFPNGNDPSYTPGADFFYGYPVFNPNNPNEIAYMRATWEEYSSLQGFDLFTFNFCTGETTLVTDNFLYNLDWGSNGWLLYTGTNNQVYKIKSNGDSLTVLSTQPGFNRAGKWNLSGTMFWYSRDDGIYYKSEDNELLYQDDQVEVSPRGWINDSTTFGLGLNGFHSLSFPSLTTNQLNSNSACSGCPKIINLDEMACYVMKSNLPTAFLRYSLSGDNQLDTLRNMKLSYKYTDGDYMNGKIVTALNRQSWNDYETNNRFIRTDILIMNADGTNERLVEIPE